MKRNPYPGKFIVFEGLDGSGKNVQTELLYRFFKKNNQKVVKTKEPTQESEYGKILKEILNQKKESSPQEIQKLFSQDRQWHIKNIIEKALKEKKIVICDRYLFSTLSYGIASGLDYKFLWSLNKKFPLPDIVFFLDVDPNTALERIKKRGEKRSLFEKKSYLERVYTAYQKVMKKFKNKTKIYFIDGKRSINEIFEEIKQILKKEIL